MSACTKRGHWNSGPTCYTCRYSLLSSEERERLFRAAQKLCNDLLAGGVASPPEPEEYN